MSQGSDTSATTLAGLFFYLAHCPQVYTKLAAAIRSTFSHFSEIETGAKLLSCTYLNACITEAMRISPSTPGIPYREVLTDGIVVDGTSIPQGVDVGTCIYALHHDPLHFSEPEKFIPERWLRDHGATEEQLSMQYAAYNPFSIGPRSCPGRMLALMEIRLTLARILWRLDFKLADGETGRIGEGKAGACGGRGRISEYQLRTHVTAASNGPVIVFRKRKGVDW